MTWLKWGFRIILLMLVFSVLHYTLPQRDIVRVVNTYEERQDFGGWTTFFWSSGSAGTPETPTNRDVLFIQTVLANGNPMVFRNEDTGWRWPPYFKFDTANLQTEAADAISSKDEPEWVAVRHYGWRNTLLSIFPNALSVKPVAGPNVFLIPWFNIIFLTILGLAVIATWVRIDRWKNRNIDPVLEDIGDAYDDVSDTVVAGRGRIGRWLDTWKSKKS